MGPGDVLVSKCRVAIVEVRTWRCQRQSGGARGRGARGRAEGHRLTAHLSVRHEPALPSASVASVEKQSFPASILRVITPMTKSRAWSQTEGARGACPRVSALPGPRSLSGHSTAPPGPPGVAVLPGPPSALWSRERRRCRRPARVLAWPGVLAGGEQRSALPTCCLPTPLPASAGQPRLSPRVAWPGGPRGGCRLPAGASRSRGFGGGDPWLGPSLQLGAALGVVCVMCFSSDELQLTAFHPNDGIW